MKKGITLVLLLCCVVIHLYSLDSKAVEQGYSLNFFPGFAAGLRAVTGIGTLSFGDILYGLTVAWILVKLWKYSAKVYRFRAIKRQNAIAKAGKFLRIIAILYIVFNLFWGINYNRVGIAKQLGMEMKEYTKDDVLLLNGMLMEKVNSYRSRLDSTQAEYPSSKELFKRVEKTYAETAVKYPFLTYKNPAIKTSLWGWVGNYTGFTGYYNPFTGEAQVNTLVPKFLQPFTACHEVAHQLGYAKEMEANFVGFLAAKTGSDPLIRYSVYLELFAYANRNLFVTDSLAAKTFRERLSPGVKADLQEWKDFTRRHQNPVAPVVRWIYGKFLQGNEQPQGMMAYDEVTGFVIAYYRKFGEV